MIIFFNRNVKNILLLLDDKYYDFFNRKVKNILLLFDKKYYYFF